MLCSEKILIDKIDQEEFKVGEFISSKRGLIQMFHMSRITVRKSADELVNERDFYKMKGKGTCVRND